VAESAGERQGQALNSQIQSLDLRLKELEDLRGPPMTTALAVAWVTMRAAPRLA